MRTILFLLLSCSLCCGQFMPMADPVFVANANNETASSAASTLNNGLVAYWKLDETSGTRADSVGSITLSDGNTVGYAAGKQGNAASFVATSSEYLYAANPAPLQFADEDFTFACWVKFTSLGTVGILNKLATVNGLRSYRLYVNISGQLFWDVSPDGNTDVVLSTPSGSVTTGAWFFVVCWHDSVANKLRICVNNGTVYETDHAGGVFNSASAFQVGTLRATLGYMTGEVDELGAWDRVLTSDEITELYNSGNGKTYPF